MADKVYAVITREAMASEYDGTKRKSAKFYNSSAPAEIENGMVVKIAGTIPGEREVLKVVAPEGSEDVADLWIVTTPEVDADERKKNLSDFVNKAGQIITIDKLMPNDIFSLTAEGLTGTAVAGHNVGLASAGGVKLVVDAATSGMGTVIGTVLDIANAKVGIMVK